MHEAKVEVQHQKYNILTFKASKRKLSRGKGDSPGAARTQKKTVLKRNSKMHTRQVKTREKILCSRVYRVENPLEEQHFISVCLELAIRAKKGTDNVRNAGVFL